MTSVHIPCAHRGSRLPYAQLRWVRSFTGLLAALVCVVATAGFASAAAITTTPFGVDLDNNGQVETEGSYLTQRFTALGAGTLSIRYMFLTSESDSGRNNNDLFLIRLFSVTNQFPNDDPVLTTGREVGGAVVDTGQPYTGTFARYDFLTGTVTRPNNTSYNPADVLLPITAPGGASGITWDTELNDGGIGWQTASFSFLASDGLLELQMFVADAGDGEFDSALAIDQITITAGASTGFGNGSFETGSLANWHPSTPGDRGEVGVFQNLTSGNATVVSPTSGSYFALLSTVDGPPSNDPPPIPEPAAVVSLTLLIAAARFRR